MKATTKSKDYTLVVELSRVECRGVLAAFSRVRLMNRGVLPIELEDLESALRDAEVNVVMQP